MFATRPVTQDLQLLLFLKVSAPLGTWMKAQLLPITAFEDRRPNAAFRN